VALFLSGSAALVYQSVWGRMLQRVFGVSDLAIATVLATFFLGLGLGSALGGRWGKSQRPARVYAILEIGIGAWALLSLLLIPRVHDVYAAIGADAGFGLLTFIRLLIAIFVLLPPTMLMGATLPILIATVSKRGVDWSSGATGLYATNTFGAVLGAGITGLFLVPKLGARTSILVAACASFAAAIVVFGFWSRVPPRTDADDDATPPPRRGLREPLPSRVRLAMLLAFVAGLASLASEVLWTRVLRMVVQGTTQAFAAMLVNYLVGIALGSLLADRLLRNPKRDPVFAFGVSQLVLAGLTVLAMLVGAHLPRFLVLMQGNTNVVPHDPGIILGVSAILLFPLALALGTSVPLAWKIAGGDADEAAEHSGRVLATNTIGGLLGSLGAGFLLVPLAGVELAILIVMLVHCIAASIALYHRYARSSFLAMLGAIFVPLFLAVGVVALQPSLHLPYLLDAWYDGYKALMEGPGEEWKDNVVFLEEGRNTTVTILNREGSLRLFNDGRPESGFGGGDPGFGEELATLGSLSTIFADQRETAMVIGLGAGHTTTVMLGGPWERIDVVELEHAVVNAARQLHTDRGKDFPLDDPRTNLIVDDARAQLVLAEEGSYDAIVSQPSHPWLAGSSALYTVEFFREAKRALRSGGTLALWSNLFRMDVRHLKSIVATLLEVFDHVQAYVVETSSFIFVASDQPLEIDAEVAARISDEGLRPWLQPFALDDVIDYVGALELDTAGAHAWSEGAPLIVDDRPALEFALARIPHFDSISQAQMDRALMQVPWMNEATFAEIPESLRADLIIQRIEYAHLRPEAVHRVRLALDDLPLPPEQRALIEGVLADQAGDVRAALAAFERAGADERAIYRADDIRTEERLYGQLIEVARTREALPTNAKPFLDAALALDRPSAMRTALELAERIGRSSDEPLMRIVRARLEHGCRGLREAIADPENEGGVMREHVQWQAMRCAFADGDLEVAATHQRDHIRLRRGAASHLQREGEEADNANVLGYALRKYARAHKAWPGNAAAAAGLARLLARFGDEDRAEEVLERAYDYGEGLSSTQRLLDGAASDLGFILGDD